MSERVREIVRESVLVPSFCLTFRHFCMWTTTFLDRSNLKCHEILLVMFHNLERLISSSLEIITKSRYYLLSFSLLRLNDAVHSHSVPALGVIS